MTSTQIGSQSANIALTGKGQVQIKIADDVVADLALLKNAELDEVQSAAFEMIGRLLFGRHRRSNMREGALEAGFEFDSTESSRISNTDWVSELRRLGRYSYSTVVAGHALSVAMAEEVDCMSFRISFTYCENAKYAQTGASDGDDDSTPPTGPRGGGRRRPAGGFLEQLTEAIEAAADLTGHEEREPAESSFMHCQSGATGDFVKPLRAVEWLLALVLSNVILVTVMSIMTASTRLQRLTYRSRLSSIRDRLRALADRPDAAAPATEPTAVAVASWATVKELHHELLALADARLLRAYNDDVPSNHAWLRSRAVCVEEALGRIEALAIAALAHTASPGTGNLLRMDSGLDVDRGGGSEPYGYIVGGTIGEVHDVLGIDLQEHSVVLMDGTLMPNDGLDYRNFGILAHIDGGNFAIIDCGTAARSTASDGGWLHDGAKFDLATVYFNMHDDEQEVLAPLANMIGGVSAHAFTSALGRGILGGHMMQ